MTRAVESSPGSCALLVGLPGPGKRTIDSALARRLEATGEVRLVDHYVADPILGLVAQDGLSPLPAEVWQRVGDVRTAVLQTIERLSPPDWTFLFTVDLADDPESHAFVRRLAALASARGNDLVVVRLVCGLEELRRQIVDPSSRAHLTSVWERDAVDSHARCLAVLERWSPVTLHATRLEPDEAAGRVLEFLSALSSAENDDSGLS